MSEPAPDLEFLYVTDPMCSWCWGFAPAIEELRVRFEGQVPVRYVMGGLAPDSDEPMAPATRAMVQGAWEAVAARTGASFNHDFWARCTPRRSTWSACRAVLAAERMRPGSSAVMFAGIQRAYYLEARNPSDVETLAQVAASLDLDGPAFLAVLQGPEVEADLQRHFALKDALGTQGFPTLALRSRQELRVLTRGWTSIEDLRAVLAVQPELAPAR